MVQAADFADAHLLGGGSQVERLQEAAPVAGAAGHSGKRGFKLEGAIGSKECHTPTPKNCTGKAVQAKPTQ